MWIDSHCHLDAAEYDGASHVIAEAARAADVNWIVIPAVERANFNTVAKLATEIPGCVYALGIHPLYVPQADEEDLSVLRDAVALALTDKKFIAIGEIGLDFFVPSLCEPAMRAKQEFFYSEQLKIARNFNLPVILHVRRSQDTILKYLRRINVASGIAHAFNGSVQQAEIFGRLGFALGFGGAMTFTRALQIRRLASSLPDELIVLETDSPDISPSWLHPARNTPAQLPQIAAVLAQLRGQSLVHLARQTTDNIARVLPRLGSLLMQ